MFLRRASLVMLLLLVPIGCDTVSPGSETVLLTTELERDTNGAPILFAFAGNLQTGRLVDLRCNCRIDLGPFLTTQGFSKSDIESAEVSAARVVMGTPVSGNLSFLDQAIIKFEAIGLSTTEVANRTGFTANREATMTVLSGRNIASFLEKATFEPVLQVDASALQANASYQVYLLLTLKITVTGL